MKDNKDLSIVIKLRVEGFHCWPEAPDEVHFLSRRHRHIFHITVGKKVSHTDRDIEIILFKRELEDYFKRNYEAPAEFGGMSCEDIAVDLTEAYNLSWCEVLEDGENGALLIS